MEVRIQAIHFDATEKLQDFIQKKTAKLEIMAGLQRRCWSRRIWMR